MSVLDVIAAYRAQIEADEALFNADGDLVVGPDEATASERACDAAWMALMAEPCRTLDDVRAKVAFMIGPRVRTHFEVLDEIVPEGRDWLDDAGPLKAFLRSLMGEGGRA